MMEVDYKGKKYKKNKKGYYVGKGGKHLHRVIFEVANGKIPKNYAVHHKDHNKDNNDINNLELMEFREHGTYHLREFEKNKEYYESNKYKLKKISHRVESQIIKKCHFCRSLFIAIDKHIVFCSSLCQHKAKNVTHIAQYAVHTSQKNNYAHTATKKGHNI